MNQFISTYNQLVLQRDDDRKIMVQYFCGNRLVAGAKAGDDGGRHRSLSLQRGPRMTSSQVLDGHWAYRRVLFLKLDVASEIMAHSASGGVVTRITRE